MKIETKSRNELKAYFRRNSIPTESNFADLIDGMANPKDDGFIKLPGNPLNIEADASIEKKTVNLYRSFEDENPVFSLGLNPKSKPTDPNSATKAGLSIGDMVGNSRLFIDEATGNVGIGTVSPEHKLHVAGKLSVDGAIQPSAGKTESSGIMFPKDPGGGGSDAAWIRYYANTGEQTVLEIGTSDNTNDHIALKTKGNIGLGTSSPTHKFHVLANNAVGLFESSGPQAYLRLSTNEGIGNRVEITNRAGGRLSLWTAGAGDVFNITKGGLVGIGTINPKAKLHIHTGSDVQPNVESGGALILGSSTGVHLGLDNNEIMAKTNATTVGTLHLQNDGGKVYIGKKAKLVFGAKTRQMIDLWNANYGIGIQSNTLYFRTHNYFAWHKGGVHSDSQLTAGTGGTRLMYLSSSRLELGVSKASKPGGGSWSSSSDIRLKKDISKLRGSLGKLLNLKGVSFKWKKPEEQGDLVGNQMGFIAQEVENIFPEWVETDDHGYRMLNIRGFEALTVESIRELYQQINALKNDLKKIPDVSLS